MEFEIEPLFAIPVARTILDNIDENIKKYLYNIPFERVMDGTCSYSISKKVLDDPVCFPLKQQITNSMEKYINDVQGIDVKDFEFYIKTSWVLKLEPGDYADEHYHSKSLYTGVLYLNVPDDSGKINLHRPQSHDDPLKKLFDWNIKNWNIYNCKRFFIQPKNNMLIFFPSYLGHSIDQNTSNIIRYGLAFDIFIKGSFDVGLPGELHL
jgi:uncharacterized protein (TIGR02466 family)